ncbi:MAG: (d)CMP kinase [Dehalococcoidia bacterium]
MDGPTASGKTTLGRGLADKLKIGFFDTGLMYRGATLSVIKNKISLTNEHEIINHINNIDIEVIWQIFSEPEILLNDINVTHLLKDKQIEDNVSIISKIPDVRTFMVNYQRSRAQKSSIVMAGRDIGTRVLIEAKVKFFLHASTEIRAQRRLEEFKDNGDLRTFKDVLIQTKRRDELDQTGKRAILAEQAASDAYIIKTEDLSIDQLIDKCAEAYIGHFG